MPRSLFPIVATVIASGGTLSAGAQLPPPPPCPSAAYYQSAAPVVQGTVSRYLMNPNGEVDGLLLADGTQVKFPPHMSDDLVATIKPAQAVSVQGFREAATSVKAFVISNGSASVTEHEPRRPPAPPGARAGALAALSAQGTVQQLLYGPRGDVNGMVLSDGSIVRFPPHVAYQIGNLLQVGQAISATGYGVQNQYGKALEATAIGAQGQALQTLYGRPGRRGPPPGPRG
jgi:hypothetical protein